MIAHTTIRNKPTRALYPFIDRYHDPGLDMQIFAEQRLASETGETVVSLAVEVGREVLSTGESLDAYRARMRREQNGHA